MKYLVSLLVGMLLGASIFVAGMYYNPFSERQTVSPLAMTDDEHLDFTYTVVPGETILYTDNGESIINTHPDRVAELWEPAIVDSRIAVNLLTDSRGEAVGLGIKFSSDSEQTRLISSQVLVNSAWHIYVPGQGTLFVDQIENYWSYLREVVVPARWSSGDNWKGSFFRVMTQGPNALGTARVTGGNGNFAGISGEAVESLTASAYSAIDGPVSMDGSLTITLPTPVSEDD
jgi:hypothetical protein